VPIVDFGIIDYCLQPTPFFDVATTSRPADFPQVGQDLPEGWLRTTCDVWAYQHPGGVACREQGWKVHVSTTVDDAEEVLDIVRGYCIEHEVPFKHLRSRQQLLARNSKYADRTASGKFIAIYPPTEGDLPGILAALESLLAGREGPTILTDLRYGAAPVFVRFGAFVELVGPDEHGFPVASIRRPDGALVPDVRRPSFQVPPWVSIPECLESAVARRRASATTLPVRVPRALHFSNGGGVYDAVDRETGERVLLKEARPWAGLDEQGRDAVSRLEVERWALETLAGAAYIPRSLGWFEGHEHHYLMREYAEGESLLAEVQRRHPDLPGQRAMNRAAYAGWALTVADRVTSALRDMHSRGVAFGDVHPNNVLLDAAGQPTFIDLETATRVEDGQPQRIGAPGFRAPDHLGGAAADRHGLACLRLSLFLPSTIILSWGPDAAHELLDEIHTRFDGGRRYSVVPRSFDDAVLADLGQAAERSTPAARLTEGEVTAFTLSSATPDRTDRLYPGAANGFRTPGGGVTPAYGASGVLWALDRLGHPVPTAHRDWLSARLPDLDCGPGLFEGWGGVACALSDLGDHDSATRALTRALEHRGTDDSLVRGRAGAGLAALRCEGLLDGAAEAARELGADLVARQAWETLGSRRGTPSWGLMDGPAGVALLLLRLHERWGDADFLAAARTALTVELDRLFAGAAWDAPLEETTPPGPWLRATLHRGSSGAAMVLADYLALDADAALTRALERLGRAHDLWHHEQPGLFIGRAGMIAALRHVGDRWPDHEHRIIEQVRLLQLHAVRDQGVAGFLGDHGLKMSCDLATGSTGVMWVVGGGTVPFCFGD
jgi:hypothetical protein